MISKRNLMAIGLLGAFALWFAFTSDAQIVTNVAAGQNHSLFLKSDGSLWVMGYNKYGQLGDDTNNNTNQPEQLVTTGVAGMAGGTYHSLFVKTDGSLWTMGFNYYGELGDGTYNLVSPYGTNQPQEIVPGGVRAAAAGQYHSLFIESDGSLWVMGGNVNGQLGDGTLNNTNRPEKIATTNNVLAIAAGAYFSLFLKTDGSLWGMGDNTCQGQLGDGTVNQTNRPELIVTNGVTAIAAGADHSLFVKNDGSLWVMGANGSGQLGDGTNINRTTGPEMIVPNNVIAIVGGQNHSLFAKRDGSLWAMGYNGYGQLGDGTYNQTNRPEPIVGFVSGYDLITIQLLSDGDAALTFTGLAGTNYALDRTFNLAPPAWVPQATNPAGTGGWLVFTNTPNPATHNFWRIRSVP